MIPIFPRVSFSLGPLRVSLSLKWIFVIIPLIMGLVSFVLPSKAATSISFDAVTQTLFTPNETTSTISHVASADATAVVVGIFDTTSSDNIQSVTWNGNTLTRVQKVLNTPSGNSIYVYVIAGSSTGTHNIVITRNSASVSGVHIATYEGTTNDTDSLWSSAITETISGATSIDGTVTNSINNSLTVAFVRNDAGNFISSSDTVRGSYSSSNLFDSDSVVSIGNDTVSANWSGLGAASMIVFQLQPNFTSQTTYVMDPNRDFFNAVLLFFISMTFIIWLVRK